VQLVLVLALVSVILPGFGKQSQTAIPVEHQSPPLIRSVEGPDLFRAYCTPCHGSGPCSALKAKVPDLTLLARNNRGQFPAARVREMIRGDKVVAAHGSREMPIWGPIFHQVEADMDWGNVRLSSLMEYLQSIQTTAASHAP
jgi:mono/diheme cytochrome c family protein